MYKSYQEEVNASRKSSARDNQIKSDDKNEVAPKSTPKPVSSKKKGDKDWRPLSRHKSTLDKDVMISYSHQNRPFMRKLKEALQARGVSVWVDETGLKAGVDFLSKIGQAIIDAKCLISLLSHDSIKSKYCQDELALAYVSQKHIFPCGLAPAKELFPLMDTGMKLQVARFQWSVFTDEGAFEQTMDSLVSRMKAAMSGDTDPTLNMDTHATDKPGKNAKLKKNVSRQALHKMAKKPTLLEKPSEDIEEGDNILFWEENFKDKQAVPWPEFLEAFNRVYKDTLTMVYTATDRDWLVGILKRELEVKDTNTVTRGAFEDFCTVEEQRVPFFTRVQDQAVESYTMREVFSMDSSVRIEAIENLGKFRSAAVVEALLDLLQDADNNVRAVAAISLARTGDDSESIVSALLQSLKDKDRLVRESGCLALGHLKASRAVPQILHLWRNDFISHVREAAQVALEQIGGEEAENAIHMTKVLSDEIRYLVQE